MFIKVIMLFLAAGAAAPDPATVIISKVAKDLASLGLWLHFSKHHCETTVRRVASLRIELNITTNHPPRGKKFVLEFGTG